ncbi:hypothetical protein [Nonomuraea soli]|uniref:Uncharacterized protein n=1 Tax=Nonomuraea soli TaxID=1032476 RepID=A0A7W0CU29_9ACTN|nr:hypothetical protein [Nonomuraea soli]MBA2897373.1 hypothetical protein [Nonomuraea soli]
MKEITPAALMRKVFAAYQRLRRRSRPPTPAPSNLVTIIHCRPGCGAAHVLTSDDLDAGGALWPFECSCGATLPRIEADA